MRIAIDINGTVRDFLNNFAKYYIRDIDPNFIFDEEKIETNNPFEIFKFKSYEDYFRFLYEDYPFEIYGRCDVTSERVDVKLEHWHTNTLSNLDIDDKIEVMIVSSMEYGLSIQGTYFFLSKIGCRIREVYLPTDSTTIWDKCDVLITTNPKLLKEKPDGKISIKINKNYNKNESSDYNFDNFIDFINDEENVLKLIKKHE